MPHLKTVPTSFVCALAVSLSALVAMPNAHAKLGDTEAESRKRFGSHFEALPTVRGADFCRRYQVSEGFTVDSTFVDGRVAAETYYGGMPLENGRPPEKIWRAIREKNVPKGQWTTRDGGLYTTMDSRFISVGQTDNVPVYGARYAIFVADTHVMPVATAEVPPAAQVDATDVEVRPDGTSATSVRSSIPASPRLARNAPALDITSQIVKRVEMPGVFFGTTTGFRYFFYVRNNGSQPFQGQVAIALYTSPTSSNRSDSFTLNLAAGAGANVYVDAYTPPLRLSSDGVGINGFRSTIDGQQVPGMSVLSERFEDMTAYRH